ncbi:LOW QUALITY PROTEIN: hypothetical protein AAY473_037196 [Plecturocebus cupreus]
MVAAYFGNKDLETLILQALQHDLMASFFTQSTTQSTVAQHSSQESTVLQARQPEAVLPQPTKSSGCRRAEMHFSTNERPQQALRHNHVASSMGISISSGGDLETLPQEALPHSGVASSIKSSTSSGGDLETLAQQALQHDLMASFFSQSTTQSTGAQHSSQESTVLQARQPEAKLGLPQGCEEMHFNTNEMPQQALRDNIMASSIGISISSGGDLENLPQLALPRNGVASSIKSSASSGGDLETLSQQALQCNCVVAACIGNKDLETLTLQALPHDLMASSFTQSTTQSIVAQQSSQEATVL